LAAGGTLTQVASELGIRTNVLGRWFHGLKGAVRKAFPGQDTPHEEAMAGVKSELTRIRQKRDFLKKRQRSSRRSHHELSDVGGCQEAIPIALKSLCLDVLSGRFHYWCNRPSGCEAELERRTKIVAALSAARGYGTTVVPKANLVARIIWQD